MEHNIEPKVAFIGGSDLFESFLVPDVWKLEHMQEILGI